MDLIFCKIDKKLTLKLSAALTNLINSIRHSPQRQPQIYKSLASLSGADLVQGVSITDRYRDYDIAFRVLGNRTQIDLTAPYPLDRHFLYRPKAPHPPRIKPQEAIERIEGVYTRSKLKGQIRANVVSEANLILSYAQQGGKVDEGYLWFVIDLLCALAPTYIALLSHGDEAFPALTPIATNREHPLHKLAGQIIETIAQSRMRWQGNYIARLWCQDCQTRYEQKSISLPSKRVSYLGCRTCGKSTGFLSGNVIAVLDSEMKVETVKTDDTIQVNWLVRQRMFDFDQVQIVNATDEQIERFVVQTGNDTDRWRLKQYKTLTCTVSADCSISENTHRILQKTFSHLIVA